MITIGGARPGTSDMALLGHGRKFGQCLGEDEAHSPFAPLHESGFAAEDSAVTVIGTEPPQSVAHVAGSDIERSSERLIELLAASVAGIGSNNAWLGGGQAVIVLTPDHIGELAAAAMIGHRLPGRSSSGPRLATVGLRSSRSTTSCSWPPVDPGSTAMSSRPGVQGRTVTGPSPIRSTSARPAQFRALMRRQAALAV